LNREAIFIKSTFTDRLAHLSDRYADLLLCGILFFALLLRVLALQNLEESVYWNFLIFDEKTYHTWATKIANGTTGSFYPYDFAPLPAYVMALVYKIFSPHTSYIRILNIVFGVSTCFLIYLIGKELANRITGLFACLIASIYKPFIFFSIVLLKTSMSLFLFASAIYLFVAILNKHSMAKVLFLGIVIGLMINVRPNCIVIVPLFALFILWNICRGRFSLKIFMLNVFLYIIGISMSMCPFIIRNYLISEEVSITSVGGFNLYLANNLQNKDPYYRPVPFASPIPYLQAIQFTIEASRRTKKKLSPKEASSYWTKEVINIAFKQPKTLMRKILQKTLVFFNQFEAADNYHIGFVSNFVKFFRLPFLSLWVILPFGMAGMAINMLKSRKSLGLSSIFILYALTLILFFTNIRIRLPILIILIPFAVIGINNLFSYIKTKRFSKIVMYSAITIAFFIIEFLPVQSTDDMTSYYNTHAIILNSKGLKDEAITYWEKSSKMNRPYSAFANLSLAGKYFGKGNSQEALYYLDKIPDYSFAAAYKYELKGDIMMHQNQIQKAIEAYEQSLDINSGQINPRIKLVRIFQKLDKERASQEYKKYQYISSFYKDLKKNH
jgi:4-amino-4-deoxy-L-arabinose transferase-like glycosyltransferase